jgi:membrane-associated phospholipid phosphatase
VVVAPRLLAAGILLQALAFAPAPARADPSPTSDAPVEWSPKWPRFRAWEYAATATLGVASMYLYRYRLPPDQPKWQGDNAVDDAIRGWLRADTRAGREAAGRVSDVLWLGGTAAPFAIDLPVILFVHRQPALAWQVLMMDLEANAVAGFINNGLFAVVGRGRPSYRDCSIDPTYDELCGGVGNNASFPSGHTLGIATGTGLVCVHHRYLRLFDHPAADTSACVVMVLATVVTATTRIMADRHYASDDLMGAAIGFASGYGLPWLLHYRHGVDTPLEADRPSVVLLPFVANGILGLGAAGIL